MATSAVVGSLRVNLGLDSAQFQAGLQNAAGRLRVARTQFLAFGAAAAAALTGVFMAARAGADDISATVDASRRLGASIGAYEALRLAADDAGVSIESITDDFQNLNRELSRAAEGGKAADALQRLGLSAADFNGLDMDAKVALLSDRIVGLGLDTGTTTQLLRDLGIRNREMVLLMMAGGDAIRAARQDVQDYGLALNAVDADRVESATDQISRLGVISRYVGQQLAVQLIPPLGALSQALTNSLRPGGMLRTVIDGLIRVVSGVVGFLGDMVTILIECAEWLGGLAVQAGAAVLEFSGLGDILSWIVDHNPLAWVINGVGWFADLIRAAGGFGEAMGLLGGVAAEVFGRIKDAFWLVPLAVKAGAASMAEWFLNALRSMLQGFQDLTWSVAEGLNSLFGTSLEGARIGAISGPIGSAPLDVAIQDASYASRSASDEMSALAGSLTAPLASVQAINDLIAGMGTTAETTTDSVEEISDALDGGGGSGGGGSGGVAGAAQNATTELTAMQQAAKRGADTIAEAFGALIDKSKSWKDVLVDILKKIRDFQLEKAFQSLASANGGNNIFGWLGSLMGANADGTRNFGGGWTRIHERGGEIANLPSGTQIIPHDISKRMADRSAVQQMAQVEIIPSPYFDARVDGRAARVTGAGM